MAYYAGDQKLPPLGALCVDYTDDIHRPPGDVIMSHSYKFPVIHQTVESATLWNVVRPTAFENDYVQKYVDACRKLEEKGCIGIITSCGFLAQLQQVISAQINIPIATSSLLQIPYVLAITSPKKRVAVLTFDSSALSSTHFKGVGVTDDMMARVIIKGCLPGMPLHNVITNGDPYIAEDIEKELVQLAEDLTIEHTDIGAFVLECTNMPPYSKAIQERVKLPVFDGVTMVNWFYSGLYAKSMPPDTSKEEGRRRRLRSEKELR